MFPRLWRSSTAYSLPGGPSTAHVADLPGQGAMSCSDTARDRLSNGIQSFAEFCPAWVLSGGCSLLFSLFHSRPLVWNEDNTIVNSVSHKARLKKMTQNSQLKDFSLYLEEVRALQPAAYNIRKQNKAVQMEGKRLCKIPFLEILMPFTGPLPFCEQIRERLLAE